MSLIELIGVLLIIGILAGIAIPPLHEVLEQARVTKAIGDIKAIQTDLMSIEAGDQALPADLDAIGRGLLLDPWGRPYVYYPFPPPVKTVPAGARRDKFLKPVNSTFDLYSLGRDGMSAPSFGNARSLDDVVRAGDGGYIGLASKH